MATHTRDFSRELGSIFFRGRFRFGYGVFRVPKNGIFKTKKRPVTQIVKIAFTLKKKSNIAKISLSTIYWNAEVCSL